MFATTASPAPQKLVPAAEFQVYPGAVRSDEASPPALHVPGAAAGVVLRLESLAGVETERYRGSLSIVGKSSIEWSGSLRPDRLANCFVVTLPAISLMDANYVLVVRRDQEQSASVATYLFTVIRD
jgi:hypothetical protein